MRRVLALLLPAAAALAACGRSGAWIEIRNESGGPLGGVRLELAAGAALDLGSIEPGATLRRELELPSGSGFAVYFLDGSGAQRRVRGEAEYGPGWQGTLELEVGGDGRIGFGGGFAPP